jgi:hypothetical protein
MEFGRPHARNLRASCRSCGDRPKRCNHLGDLGQGIPVDLRALDGLTVHCDGHGLLGDSARRVDQQFSDSGGRLAGLLADNKSRVATSQSRGVYLLRIRPERALLGHRPQLPCRFGKLRRPRISTAPGAGTQRTAREEIQRPVVSAESRAPRGKASRHCPSGSRPYCGQPTRDAGPTCGRFPPRVEGGHVSRRGLPKSVRSEREVGAFHPVVT